MRKVKNCLGIEEEREPMNGGLLWSYFLQNWERF